MRSHRLLLVLLSSACGGTVCLAGGGPVDFVRRTSDGDGADATIRGGSFQDESLLEPMFLNVLNGESLSDTRKSYLRFDLRNVPGDVVGGRLRLRFSSTFNPFDPVGATQSVRLFLIPDAGVWREDSLTWATAPLNDLTSGRSFRPPAAFLGSIAVTAGVVDGDVLEFDNAALDDALMNAGNGSITFGLASSSVVPLRSTFVFASKEHPTMGGPELVLEVVGGPCSAVDLAAPYGSLGPEDVAAFLQHFGSRNSAADLGLPAGVFDIGDVVAFLTAFGAGCP